LIEKRGAKSADLGYRGYPANMCISVNEEVVHGIPSKRKLIEGDIVSLDVTVVKNGFFADAAETCIVQTNVIPEDVKTLVKVTEESLYCGIAAAIVGNRVGDISHTIQEYVEKYGFSVIRDFIGHGIGLSMHEEPAVPNFGDPGKGVRLKEGMVLAIEPMVGMGGPEVDILSDGWTVVMRDTKPAAHFEHTVAITKQGPKILTKL
jgi:methionyl aminopeptidase